MKKIEMAQCQSRIDFIKARIVQIEGEMRDVLEGTSEEWKQAPFSDKKVEFDVLRIGKAKQLLEEQIRELNNHKRELEIVLMRRKGLESLKDKQLSDYKVDENRREQKRLDETYSLIRKK